MAKINRELFFFVDTNHTPDHSPMLPFVRGIFIKHGDRLKKLRDGRVLELLSEIHTLETQHKHMQTQTTLARLTTLQEQLKFLTIYKAKAKLARCTRAQIWKIFG